MLPELWLLIQCALATWIVWESLQALAAKFLRSELHLLIVAALAYGAIVIPAEIRVCLVISAIVATLHVVFTRRESNVANVLRAPVRR